MSAGLAFWCFMTLASIFVVALLSAALYPLLRSGLGTIRPALRANILLGWCVTPIGLGVIIALAPWVLGAMGLAPAECGRLGDVALPVCGPDCVIGPVFPTMIDLFLLAPFAGFIVWTVRRFRVAAELNTRIGSLVSIGQPYDENDVVIFDNDEPLAFCAGWFRSRIVIASCLQKQLSEDQMRAVLAHERAHANRHDAFRYFIAEITSSVHLPWVRTSLLDDLRLATEQACDEIAVQADGDRLGMAETLLKVERLFDRRTPGPAVPVHLLAGDLEARVEALLGNGRCPAGRWRRMWLAGAAFCGVAAIVSAVPLHEWMGSFLVYVQG